MSKSGLSFKRLRRRTAMQAEFQSLTSDETVTLPEKDIIWIAKIIWAGQ